MPEHAATHEDEDDGYTGPATVVIAEQEHTVEVAVTGHFEPISGSYVWYGRLRGLPEQAGGTALLLRIPDGAAQAVISERDLWGNHLFRGVGAPPFRAFDPSVLD